MSNNLGNVITSTVARKVIYGAYVVAGVFFGATSAGFSALSAGVIPEWVTVGLAVLGWLSIPIGGLALVNTPSDNDTLAQADVTFNDTI